ncbi:MAG: 2-phospho-L-lactate guanylyltransferase [Solirubrobacterales bacterium]|nr:2-phospho-L-lactate guanylyltransferase [Solirubrobacterales bacterium]MBV9715749.1 2-phospho-L-lactate guanylyltransferase [Solirubrobacterales bacterium]
MATLAVLPMKSFSQAKHRLRNELSAGDRRALVEAMFCDVLIALRRAAAVARVVVVSADRGAQQIAVGYGATVVSDAERGHNHAATVGVRAVLELGGDRALLVPGDCPAVSPGDLDALIARPAAPRSVLIVPDRHGTGTNALLLTPPDALATSFGAGSRRRHVTAAAGKNVEAEVVEVGSLAMDVDTPDDLATLRRALSSSHGGAPHTRGLLTQLVRSRA